MQPPFGRARRAPKAATLNARTAYRAPTTLLVDPDREPGPVGAPGSVTPIGRFYVTDPVNCNKESVPGYPAGSCSSAYGVFAIGTSGLSEQLDSFQGTIPQIALHGTNLPASELGKDLSNGCVRMPNDVILQIASITPLLGTPVTITPF